LTFERLYNYLGKSPFFGHGQSGVSYDSEDLISDVLWDGIVYFTIPSVAELLETIRLRFQNAPEIGNVFLDAVDNFILPLVSVSFFVWV
jgi:hypothetical protein